MVPMSSLGRCSTGELRTPSKSPRRLTQHTNCRVNFEAPDVPSGQPINVESKARLIDNRGKNKRSTRSVPLIIRRGALLTRSTGGMYAGGRGHPVSRGSEHREQQPLDVGLSVRGSLEFASSPEGGPAELDDGNIAYLAPRKLSAPAVIETRAGASPSDCRSRRNSLPRRSSSGCKGICCSAERRCTHVLDDITDTGECACLASRRGRVCACSSLCDLQEIAAAELRSGGCRESSDSDPDPDEADLCRTERGCSRRSGGGDCRLCNKIGGYVSGRQRLSLPIDTRLGAMVSPDLKRSGSKCKMHQRSKTVASLEVPRESGNASGIDRRPVREPSPSADRDVWQRVKAKISKYVFSPNIHCTDGKMAFLLNHEWASNNDLRETHHSASTTPPTKNRRREYRKGRSVEVDRVLPAVEAPRRSSCDHSRKLGKGSPATAAAAAGSCSDIVISAEIDPEALGRALQDMLLHAPAAAAAAAAADQQQLAPQHG